jgi:hypothetical protein
MITLKAKTEFGKGGVAPKHKYKLHDICPPLLSQFRTQRVAIEPNLWVGFTLPPEADCQENDNRDYIN